MSTTLTPPLDEAKVEQFTHQIIGDMGAAISAVLIRIGDRLGLYRALGDSLPVTSLDLAAKTGLAERYVREWLHNQAAAGWVTYNPDDTTFTLPAEHALLLADEHSPAYLLGGFDIAAAVWADEEILADAFRTGPGSVGTSTTPGCSPVPNGSSAPATRPTWSAPGYRPSTG